MDAGIGAPAPAAQMLAVQEVDPRAIEDAHVSGKPKSPLEVEGRLLALRQQGAGRARVKRRTSPVLDAGAPRVPGPLVRSEVRGPVRRAGRSRPNRPSADHRG